MHPNLLHNKQSHGQIGDRSAQSSQLKSHVVARNKEAEAAHIQKIVTTRGEGLTDLLMMKKDFDRHTTKFSKLLRRVEDIEKGNSFIRNLDLEAMVTPGALEEKVRQEIDFVEQRQDSMNTAMTNQVESRLKEVTVSCEDKIKERVGKREYKNGQNFMLAINREAKSLAQQAMSMTDNLQTKYENLDSFFASKLDISMLNERVDKMYEEFDKKIRERSDSYGDEDESQNNDSIEDVNSEELGGDDSKQQDDAKSRQSFQHVHSNPDLVKPDEVKSFGSGARKKSTNRLHTVAADVNLSSNKKIDSSIHKPIMEVVTTLQDPTGQTSQIKGVSIVEDEMRSTKKSAKFDFDGKSQKSFARSIRSRKLGSHAQQLVGELQDRLMSAEEQLENLKSQIDEWKDQNEPNWNLLYQHMPELQALMETLRNEGGVIGAKSWKDNPFGSAAQAFDQVLDDVEELYKKNKEMHEDADMEKEEQQRQTDCISKAVKQLQDQKLRRDEFDDRRIQAHIAKALQQVEDDLETRLSRVMGHVKNMQEPIHAKFLVLSKEAEGMSRQNARFVALYRECLRELQNEIKEKKQVLDTSQLAFLTADPGLVQTKINSLMSSYHKQKVPVHGIPNQTEQGQIWSRYTSEAAQLKIDDLQGRIKEAEKNYETQQKAVYANAMTPKAINIGDCFNPSKNKHSSIGGNPDLDIQLVQSEHDEGGMIFDRNDLTQAGTRGKRRGVSTSYGNRSKNAHLATLSNLKSTRAGNGTVKTIGFQFENQETDFDIASGKTLLLSSPNSEDGPQHFHSQTQQHITPVVNQRKLVSSHTSAMNSNVAKFIKDNSMGNRSKRNNQGASTAAGETVQFAPSHNAFSSATSRRANGAGSLTNRPPNSSKSSMPKNQMLTLQFKKVLDK